jgi:tRNA1Val (adenine37-N6)-methyltransferase
VFKIINYLILIDLKPFKKIKVNQITSDFFLNRKIQVFQPVNGYRFSIDSIILAGLSSPPASATVLDLGTGCGIIPLVLAHKSSNLRLIGVEIQPSLVDMALKNIKTNRMTDRISIFCKDMCKLSQNTFDTVIDYVICNPPYRSVQAGRINPNPQKALARHELAINLPQLISIAHKLLRIGGRFISIYPSERLTDVIFHMRQKAIEPKKVHIIFSKQNQPAKLVVIEGVRGGRPGIQEISSLIIYRPDGKYTPEIARMLRN